MGNLELEILFKRKAHEPDPEWTMRAHHYERCLCCGAIYDTSELREIYNCEG
jgi:hypothetical protein